MWFEIFTKSTLLQRPFLTCIIDLCVRITAVEIIWTMPKHARTSFLTNALVPTLTVYWISSSAETVSKILWDGLSKFCKDITVSISNSFKQIEQFFAGNRIDLCLNWYSQHVFLRICFKYYVNLLMLKVQKGDFFLLDVLWNFY